MPPGTRRLGKDNQILAMNSVGKDSISQEHRSPWPKILAEAQIGRCRESSRISGRTRTRSRGPNLPLFGLLLRLADLWKMIWPECPGLGSSSVSPGEFLRFPQAGLYGQISLIRMENF